MNTLINDFKSNVKLSYIGITGMIADITSITEINGGFYIACDNGNPFAVTADKIHYTNVIIGQ